MAKKVIGYIIKAANGSHLAKKLYWYKHDCDKDAYVHPENKITDIRNTFKEIERQLVPGDILSVPKTMLPAEWSEETGVTITGDPVPFPA